MIDDRTMLRRVQMIQLDILKTVDSICRNNNITYYMIGGTLLGAVRHKGFIPWDDDLDIGMMRNDYDRFTELCKTELPNDLFLQNTLNDGLWMFITKIRKNGTIFEDDISIKSKCHSGIYIDIFPLDNLPKDNSIWQEISFMAIRFLSAIAAYKNGKRDFKSLTIKTLCRVMKLLPFSFLNGAAKYFATRYNYRQTGYVTSFMSNYGYKKQRMSRDEVYSDGVCLQFEDSWFIAPTYWKAYLEQLYGDYMTLPPVEKRGDRHVRLKVQIGNEK